MSETEAAFAAGYAAAREIQAQGATGTPMTADSAQQPDLPGLLARDPQEQDQEGSD